MLDFNQIKIYSINNRKNLVKIEDFPDPNDASITCKEKNLEILADKIKESEYNIAMIGGHVIKTGMSVYLNKLIEKGFIQHIAMNGAAAIHDFEIAYHGETSEDVSTSIKDGTFGFVRETPELMNQAINSSNDGMGTSLAKAMKNFHHRNTSLLYTSHIFNVPATVHVSFGTDIIHMHPSFDPEKTGRATYDDFKTFTESVSKLEDGTIMNIGSAVIMPEVFLKSLSLSRNLTGNPKKFTAANLDMIDHYRPRENIVNRPTQEGGLGLNIKAKHQDTIPSLYKLLVS